MKKIDLLSFEKIYSLTKKLIDSLEEDLQELQLKKTKSSAQKKATITTTLTKLVALLAKLSQIQSLNDEHIIQSPLELEDLKLLENYLKKYQKNE